MTAPGVRWLCSCHASTMSCSCALRLDLGRGGSATKGEGSHSTGVPRPKKNKVGSLTHKQLPSADGRAAVFAPPSRRLCSGCSTAGKLPCLRLPPTRQFLCPINRSSHRMHQCLDSQSNVPRERQPHTRLSHEHLPAPCTQTGRRSRKARNARNRPGLMSVVSVDGRNVYRYIRTIQRHGQHKPGLVCEILPFCLTPLPSPCSTKEGSVSASPPRWSAERASHLYVHVRLRRRTSQRAPSRPGCGASAL
jgi:hypothetical protein